MSRGLLLFLFFCVSLLIVGFVGASVLGTNKLDFIFHEHRSSESFVMLSLAQAQIEGQETEFTASLDAMLKEVGADLLWNGRVRSVEHGRERDHWPALVLAHYPSRSDFIKHYTASQYEAPFGLAVPNPGEYLMLAASSETTFDANSGVYLLELMQLSKQDVSPDNYLSSDELLASGVQGVWIADLNPVSASDEQQWQKVKMTGFENIQSLHRWLDNIEYKTQSSLRQRYYRRYVALIVESL